MKIFSVMIMVMRYTLKVKKSVLFFVGMGHQRTNTCKGKRLPAHANNQENFDQFAHKS
jgi:hypothetical protein